MSDHELFREVSRWLRYAREDLDIAVSIIENEQALRAACFHAQQCAEKAIKTSLIFLQIDFPKTHNLRQLCELLPEGWRYGKDPTLLSSLSFWAVEPRYPGDMPEAAEDDAREAVRMAREAYETTVSDLASRGYENGASR
jgi:HEPN domain-containing protein